MGARPVGAPDGRELGLDRRDIDLAVHLDVHVTGSNSGCADRVAHRSPDDQGPPTRAQARIDHPDGGIAELDQAGGGVPVNLASGMRPEAVLA
ncbi:hypothetical protein GCM10009573_15670 [Agromyces bracchium]